MSEETVLFSWLAFPIGLCVVRLAVPDFEEYFFKSCDSDTVRCQLKFMKLCIEFLEEILELT